MKNEELKNLNISKKLLNEIISKFNDADFSDNTNELLAIVFHRSNLDDISANILSKIDTYLLDQEELDKIKQMFYFNPKNFITYKVYKLGFTFDEEMAKELVYLMESTHNEEFFRELEELLIPFIDSNVIIGLLIDRIVSQNNCLRKNDKMILKSFKSVSSFLFREFVIKNVKFKHLTLEFFVKLIYYYMNEKDLNLVICFAEKFNRTFKESGSIPMQMKNSLLGWYNSKKLCHYSNKIGILIHKILLDEYEIDLVELLKKSKSTENQHFLAMITK